MGYGDGGIRADFVGAFCVVDEGNAEERPEKVDERVVVVYAVFLLEVIMIYVVFDDSLKCYYLR